VRIDAQPGGQPDAPIHGFYLASVGAARRLPYSLGMLQLFASGERPRIDVVASDKAFWARFTRDCEMFADSPNGSSERVDLRLFEKIEAVVRPVLGAWERGNPAWWHNVDWNGDGVRSLAFNLQVFPRSFIASFHKLLVVEHANLCVLCQFYRGPIGDSE
jgi:hypothetical protein